MGLAFFGGAIASPLYFLLLMHKGGNWLLKSSNDNTRNHFSPIMWTSGLGLSILAIVLGTAVFGVGVWLVAFV